jgi:3-oxoadipate enol-lactonase
MPEIDVSGHRIHYQLHGGGDDSTTPLVLLMSLGGSCRGWLPLQIPAFSPTRRVVIFDNRGVASSQDPGGAFATSDLADDTVGLLDALEIERADLLGAFMGGMIAQEVALRHPERVRRIVLSGTYARPDAKRRMLLQDWADLAEFGVPLEKMSRKRLLWTLQEETLEQRDLIESMLDFFSKEGVPLSSDLFVRQCRACIEHDTLDRLHLIEHPTLIVCGRQDQLTPNEFHRILADRIPNARLVTIRFGAHLVMVESAERFNQSVLQFLDEAEADRG